MIPLLFQKVESPFEFVEQLVELLHRPRHEHVRHGDALISRDLVDAEPQLDAVQRLRHELLVGGRARAARSVLVIAAVRTESFETTQNDPKAHNGQGQDLLIAILLAVVTAKKTLQALLRLRRAAQDDVDRCRMIALINGFELA